MTSPSTLIRKAAKATNPRTAKRLRNEAAKLRRAIRATKAKTATKSKKLPAKKAAKKPKKSSAADIRPLPPGPYVDPQVHTSVGGVNRDRRGNIIDIDRDRQAEIAAARGMMDASMQAETFPLITGDKIERLRAIAATPQDPGEPDAFAIALRASLVDAKVKGRREVEDQHVQTLKTVHEVNSINVVSAFCAEIEAIQKLNGGPLPPSLMLSGYTVARVYSALRDAGYTADGKSGVNRATIGTRR